MKHFVEEKTWSLGYAMRKRREWSKERGAPAVKCEAVAESISCDECGDEANEWDWSAKYDRVCIRCLARESDGWDFDPRAARADFEYARNR